MAEETLSADDLRLRELGYKPVFKRNWNNTISAMSVLLSVPAGFGTGLTYGGPAMMVWGWVGVSICSICVALGMAELSSAYPTSGGMYYWMYCLLGPKYGPFVCWVNGWLNLLGQISSLAGTHYATTTLLETFILLATGTARPPDTPAALDGGNSTDIFAPPPPDTPAAPGDVVAAGEEPLGSGFVFTTKQTLGLYAAILVLTASLNSFGGKLMVWLTDFAAYFHIIGVAILIIGVPLIATEHADAKWVFTQFYSDLGEQYGINNKFYIAIIGLLLPAFAYTGYDGPAHMAEESNDAAIANPRGIMQGMYFMAVTGFVWIISLLFCVTDRLYILGETDITPEADGDPVPQIFWDAFQQRTGNGKRSLGFLIIPLLGVFFCSLSTLTYVARILFCYSRDRAVGGPNKVPIFAVWGAAILAFVIATPSVRNELAFNAMLSLSTIALSIAYVAPSFVRITFGRHRFKPGPWHLGKWAYPINTVGTLWVAFAVVIFSLPTEYPVDKDKNLNYSGIVLLGVFFLSVIWFWCPFIGAYRWFKGPINEILKDEQSVASKEQLADVSAEDGDEKGNLGAATSAP